MTSNHDNLYITVLALVLRALRSTHAKMNGTEEEKGENGDRNGDGNGDVNNEGGKAGAERGKERQKGRRAQAGGGVGAGGKEMIPLVGDV